MKKKLFILLLYLFAIPIAYSLDMAITVDDLPGAGSLPANQTRVDVANKMLAVFDKHHLQNVYGFINGGRFGQKTTDAVLQLWVDHGQLLGNHTYTHPDLTTVETENYIKDIQKNDPILKKFMGNKNYRYFRYPFLSEGKDLEQRQEVRDFLFKNGYQVAPVTVDFLDFEWNNPYVRCLQNNNQDSVQWIKAHYLKHALSSLAFAEGLSQTIFKRDVKQILILHINALTAEMLDELLSAYEKKGVNFISLPEALSDPIYKIDAKVVDHKTYHFLSQIMVMRGQKLPADIAKLQSKIPRKQLNNLCVSKNRIQKTEGGE